MLLLVSAMLVLPMTVFQSSATARLYEVPSFEEPPSSLRIRLIAVLSVLLSVMVNELAEVISTSLVSVSVYVAPPSPVKVSSEASISLVAPLALTKFEPETVNVPVLASYVAEVIDGVCTLLAVILLPVVSALPLCAGFQSAAAAIL
ncbi:MAG: hypothetical protein E6Q59_09580 [Nitrosomonas sp.]|nr:MAG: hypothetical protein E6Q59_09580 [Nitrosomonas sp.]